MDYWGPKLARNVARDSAVNEALEEAGWTVVRGWEHETPTEIANRVTTAISGR
jgi:DNA mismatch endonuclease (patch repair protein)